MLRVRYKQAPSRSLACLLSEMQVPRDNVTNLHHAHLASAWLSTPVSSAFSLLHQLDGPEGWTTLTAHHYPIHYALFPLQAPTPSPAPSLPPTI